MADEIASRGRVDAPDLLDINRYDFRERHSDGVISQRLDWLEKIVADLQSRNTAGRDTLPSLLTVSFTGNKWQETYIGAATDNTFAASMRACNSTADSSVILMLGANTAPLAEFFTAKDSKYLLVGAVSAAKITGHNGTGPVEWNPYTGLFPDNSTGFLYNAFEPAGGLQQPTLPTDTTGTLTGLTCAAQPVGTTSNFVPVSLIIVGTTSRWTFAIPTSYK